METATTKPLVNLSPKLYEVEINISPVANDPYYAAARLGKPAAKSDYAFAKNSGALYRDTEDVQSNEEEVVLQEAAAIALFDEIVEEVRGYRYASEAPEAASQWRAADDTLKQLIPGTHKASFIHWMRQGSAKYVGSDFKSGFVLGGSATLPVDYVAGPAHAPLGTVHFEVPEPEETERREFEAAAMKMLQGSLDGRRTSRTVTDMEKCVEFFQMLMKRNGAQIVGGRIGEQTFDRCETPASRAAFLQEIDPHIQTKVIGAALMKYVARVRV